MAAILCGAAGVLACKIVEMPRRLHRGPVGGDARLPVKTEPAPVTADDGGVCRSLVEGIIDAVLVSSLKLLQGKP